MSLTEEQITAKNFQEFYGKIRPFLNGSFPTPIVNKFSKGDLYSTEEKIIGQWIDGKPLWQKTITGLNISLTWNNQYYAYAYIDKLVANVDKIIGATFYNNAGICINGDLKQEETRWQVVMNEATWGINAITVQYTKSTDSPISIGDGNDYSTDEQVVGTWIDGKPVYQKVVSVPSTSTAWGTIYTVENADYLNVLQARYYYGASGTEWIKMSMANGNDVLIIATNGNNIVMNAQGYTFGANNPVEMIIQYTKTTDTATS